MTKIKVIILALLLLSLLGIAQEKKHKTFKSVEKALKSQGPIKSFKSYSITSEELESMAKNIDRFQEIESLFLVNPDESSAQISIPQEFSQLTQLRELTLQGFKDDSWSFLSNYRNLTSLSIIVADLGEIPSEVYNLQHLKQVSFALNCISSVSDSIWKLTELEIFECRNCSFEKFPSELSACPKLIKIDLGNQEGGISPHKIYTVITCFNYFNTIPSDLDKFNALKYLWLNSAASPEVEDWIKKEFPDLK